MHGNRHICLVGTDRDHESVSQSVECGVKCSGVGRAPKGKACPQAKALYAMRGVSCTSATPRHATPHCAHPAYLRALHPDLVVASPIRGRADGCHLHGHACMRACTPERRARKRPLSKCHDFHATSRALKPTRHAHQRPRRPMRCGYDSKPKLLPSSPSVSPGIQLTQQHGQALSRT